MLSTAWVDFNVGDSSSRSKSRYLGIAASFYRTLYLPIGCVPVVGEKDSSVRGMVTQHDFLLAFIAIGS